MEFEVVATSDNRNSFGLTGHILHNSKWGYFQAGSNRVHPVGSTIAVSAYRGGDQFFGLNWAAAGFEIPELLKDKKPGPVPAAPEPRKPMVCVSVFQGNAVGAFRMEASEVPRVRSVIRRWTRGRKYDRYEIKPV